VRLEVRTVASGRRDTLAWRLGTPMTSSSHFIPSSISSINQQSTIQTSIPTTSPPATAIMLSKPPTPQILRLIRLALPAKSTTSRPFSLLNPTQRSHTNRVFDPIRYPQDLHTLTMLSAADNRTLITLWSAKWCQTCQVVKPIILRLLEEEKLGVREGGLGFAEVEMDSMYIGDLPVTYRVSSIGFG
jgi:thiol-disulfide isomerase/thioredoxin